MTFQECLDLFKSNGLPPSCTVSVDGPVAIHEWAIIISASAVAISALIAFLKLQSFRTNSITQIGALLNAVEKRNDATSKAARLRATLDVLTHILIDSDWRNRRHRFIELRDSADGLKKYAADPKHRNSDDALLILNQLNLYEMIALGIKQGILDEQMYKQFYRGTVIRDYKASAEYIGIERKENSKYFILFEALAKKWDKAQRA